MAFSKLYSVIKNRKKRKTREVSNPWTGTIENVEASKESAKPDPDSFQTFTAKSLSSTTQKIASIKMPNLGKHRIFRKVMRLTSAGLIFIYSIVFFFSFGNIICILFLATDLVLLYLLWLSRR